MGNARKRSTRTTRPQSSDDHDIKEYRLDLPNHENVVDIAEAKQKRPISRSDAKRAARVKKREEADRKQDQADYIRELKGKPRKEKKSFWERTAEAKTYFMLREMGDTEKNINKFQRKRVFFTLILTFVGFLAGQFVHPWLFLAGPIVGFTFYKMEGRKVETFYRAWKFQRQLNFSKFTRLVIPYLKASNGNMSLYTIFNKILKRTEDESDRRSLYQLIGEMSDNPESLKPFTDFANRSSGTDMSHLFMSTIFDFQQSTFDVSVIDELGRMASEDMMNAIDEIIDMKIRRFVLFPTKVVMTSFILVAGLGVALMVHNFKDLDFGGGDILSPTEQAEKAKDTSATDTEKAKKEQSESSNPLAAFTGGGAIDQKISEIASSDQTPARKAGAVSDYAAGYEPKSNDLKNFESYIIDHYKDGSYLGKDEKITLGVMFRSQVIMNQADIDDDTRIIATNINKSAKHVFRGFGDADSATVKGASKEIDKLLDGKKN